MKVVIEFGIRGGRHVDNIILPTPKLADQLARGIAFTYGRDMQKVGEFLVGKDCPRQTWTSSTHFVSVTRLDGSQQGAASGKLWKTP